MGRNGMIRFCVDENNFIYFWLKICHILSLNFSIQNDKLWSHNVDHHGHDGHDDDDGK